MPRAHFGPELFRFLRELSSNNRRDWFAENKERYETHVKEPMLRFISDAGPALAKVSRHVVADPRPVGGSMFRIYRDTRFSKDKTPYKTAASAHFPHRARGKDVHAPGYYLHLEPGGCFVAGGLWRPEPAVAQRIRERIVARAKSWKAAVAKIELEGESLKRPPRGVDPEHPLAGDLRRKDFITSFPVPDAHVSNGALLADFTAACKKMSPLMAFLTEAMDLEW